MDRRKATLDFFVATWKEKNYSSRFVAIEIGALGNYLNRTCKSLNRAFPSIPKTAIRNLLFNEEGKTAITANIYGSE